MLSWMLLCTSFRTDNHSFLCYKLQHLFFNPFFSLILFILFSLLHFKSSPHTKKQASWTSNNFRWPDQPLHCITTLQLNAAWPKEANVYTKRERESMGTRNSQRRRDMTVIFVRNKIPFQNTYLFLFSGAICMRLLVYLSLSLSTSFISGVNVFYSYWGIASV